ncbi:hypothetical protein E2553_35995 [Paraburkholderia dipogonis]|uniref:YCII-related domain-containing protein n=2 Tax=Paraburkholderia dipogonis TaxID=1211383 RepID=A0A4Y8MY60_9BURK|nr:hypothetical protein E2553_35995 [Paraburkholderia dipogonis]
MKYFLCKFIPPRPNFLGTMSADEKEWMKQHGRFLDSLLDQGLVVAHGPVIDSAGGYGVSLFQLPDEQDVAELTSQDPIVRNGVGHYEHFPMLHLKVRDSS